MAKTHVFVKFNGLNDRGELLVFAFSEGNIDACKPLPGIAELVFLKLFGDRVYVSQPLFEKLYAQGLEPIARQRKNIKNSLVKLMDKILLRKRAIME